MAKDGNVTIQSVPLNKIKLARNSRMDVTDEEIAGLMASIKEVGLLQPIGVVKNKNGDGFEVCYGNRRFLAVSKLGMSKIPVIIHASKKAFDGDIKNLTENIQRRNLTLTEAGRYMTLLNKEGLSLAEIAVRLGVSKSYVGNCLDAFNRVPKDFQADLEVRTTGDRSRTPGKISISMANAIIGATKHYGLSKEQTRMLYKAAKSEDKFSLENIPKYAAAISSGQKDFLKAVEPVKYVSVRFFMKQSDYDALEKQYVIDGPFRSINGLMVAILKGEKSVRVKAN